MRRFAFVLALMGALWVIQVLGVRADEVRPAALVSNQVVHVHRIVKSACLVLSGAPPEVHLEDISTSSAAMRSGFQALSIDSPRSDGTLIASARRDGDVLTRAALQIVAGDRHSVAVAQLLRKGPLVTARLEALSSLPGGAFLQAIHDVRVRSQRAQRDLCLLRIGLVGERAVRRLAADSAAIPDVLAGLQDGNRRLGLDRAPNIHIKVAIGKAASKWRSLAPIAQRAVDGDTLDLRDVQVASVLVDAMLGNLNEALGHFDALRKPPG
ncbi:MAG: hypothetical protein AAGF60_08965 [Pseudomonadota bacterium]